MRSSLLLNIAALVLLVAASLASAQTGEWDATWSTIDGGGATSSGENRFALSGTIGQPDTGSMEGPGYTLYGGFWGPTTGPGSYAVYLPLIVR